MNSITLGAMYTDKITGFRGVATGHCEYISGCNQTLLTPRVNASGEKAEGSWLDDQRLERVDGEVIVLENGEKPGCDMAPPIR